MAFTLVDESSIPLAFASQLQELESSEHDSITFQCEVTKSNATAKWLKNEDEIESSDKYNIHAQGKKHSLTIHDVTLDDEGEYTCVIGDTESIGYLFVDGM